MTPEGVLIGAGSIERCASLAQMGYTATPFCWRFPRRPTVTWHKDRFALLMMLLFSFAVGAGAMGLFTLVTRSLPPDCRDGQVALRESHQDWACFDVQEITVREANRE